MEFFYYLMDKIFDPPPTGIQTGGFPHNNHNSQKGAENMYRYLAGRLKQLGIRQCDLAQMMGIESQGAVSDRFTGRVPWKIHEMYQVLGICQAQPEELHIYFPPPPLREAKKKRRGAA